MNKLYSFAIWLQQTKVPIVGIFSGTYAVKLLKMGNFLQRAACKFAVVAA